MNNSETQTQELPAFEQKHSIGDKQVEYVKTERAGYYRIMSNWEKLMYPNERNELTEEEIEEISEKNFNY